MYANVQQLEDIKDVQSVTQNLKHSLTTHAPICQTKSRSMEKSIIIVAIFTALTAFTVIDKTWKNDQPHSQLGFTVKHLGISEISGTFNDFQVTINSKKPDFSDSKIVLTAKVASINTRIEERDTHLKSEDFFDANKFPEINFQSTTSSL